MAVAAKRFLDSLPQGKAEKATFRFADPERLNWHFIPRDRLGLPIKELTAEQRALAFGLISTGLGGGGYLKATTIMSLEQILLELEQGKGPLRDPERYFLTIFGTPLTHRIVEGRAVVAAAEKYKRVTQVGNLIHAGENYHRVVEIVRSRVLGTISKTRVWMAADRGGLGKPADCDPPAGCDYEFWLGPAPSRAFNPNRFTFNWRWFWDYGGAC